DARGQVRDDRQALLRWYLRMMRETNEISVRVAGVERVGALALDGVAGGGQARPPGLALGDGDGQGQAVQTRSLARARGAGRGRALDGQEGGAAEVEPDRPRPAGLVVPATEDGEAEDAGVEGLGAGQVTDHDGDVVDEHRR